MQTYTIEYAFQDKEQTTRTCEVELDRTPDLKDNEQLADLYVNTLFSRHPLTQQPRSSFQHLSSSMD
ncbi:hypothetical protein ACW7EJ_10900 [Acinetobacter soli]